MCAGQLPLLPGLSLNSNIGKCNFHKSQIFEINRGMPMITDKEKKSVEGIPSLYPKGEVTEVPAWIAYDRKVLSFDAYFQETAQERDGYAYHVRKCKLYFYLDDGTISVNEPRLRNSGIAQGILMRRQRIPYPPPRHAEFYDILDLNIGYTVELFGRVFKITNCDAFTRCFLNRLGIPVPDPIPTPPDPYQEIRDKAVAGMAPKRPNRYVDTRGQFVEHHSHILRFCGYWDNRHEPFGLVHHLSLRYYLEDDTIEIKEMVPPNTGRETKGLFLSRCKLPKYKMELPHPGSGEANSVLNLMSTGFMKGRFITDPLNSGVEIVDTYTDKDLCIGATINVYGRKVVLTDCDNFTKEWYRNKYGIEDFTPALKPLEKPVCITVERAPLPPWNGWGSYEDSAGNCRKMLPEPPKKDFVKFFDKDRQGLDSKILRFRAKLVSNVPENSDREFIIAFYLSDDTISVYERVRPNSGFIGGTMFARRKVYKPGQDMFQSEEPEWYKEEDMFVGNTLSLNDFLFVLVDADEYALRYMELHTHEFPKTNKHLIMDKLRKSLKPVYKNFVKKYLEESGERYPAGKIPYCEMRQALKEILCDRISEQELVTLARTYTASDQDPGTIDKESLRAIVQTELKRALYYDLDRLTEGFYEIDRLRTGFVDKLQAYALCRGAKVPLDKACLKAVLDAMPKSCDDKISYPDLIQFFDYKKCPTFHSIPISQKITFGILPEKPLNLDVSLIDIERLLKDLNLESDLAKEGRM